MTLEGAFRPSSPAPLLADNLSNQEESAREFQPLPSQFQNSAFRGIKRGYDANRPIRRYRGLITAPGLEGGSRCWRSAHLRSREPRNQTPHSRPSPNTGTMNTAPATSCAREPFPAPRPAFPGQPCTRAAAALTRIQEGLGLLGMEIPTRLYCSCSKSSPSKHVMKEHRRGPPRPLHTPSSESRRPPPACPISNQLPVSFHSTSSSEPLFLLGVQDSRLPLQVLHGILRRTKH